MEFLAHLFMKIMENEENRGIIDKKDYEDWLARYCSHFWSSLIIPSLSLSHTWTLRVSLSILALNQERKESKKNEEASKE